MRTIEISKDSKKNVLSYNKDNKTFYGSEKDIPFDTSYKVVNTDTNQSRLFEFTHSTGPEFDPKTQWVYKNSDSNIQLIISNDAEISRINGENYMKSKINR
jgi:hypothetical protein